MSTTNDTTTDAVTPAELEVLPSAIRAYGEAQFKAGMRAGAVAHTHLAHCPAHPLNAACICDKEDAS